MVDSDGEISSGAPTDAVLRTVGLTKRYGRRAAVDGLSLEVRRGQIYGFLGPNGAGKTTTITMLLGLVEPTSGHVEMFGLDTREHRSEALRRTGAVLEGPAFYADLSARDNLRIWAALSGGVERARQAEMLDLVGLASRSGDKVRTYSQGMKQRLALAAALLDDPELIVLDEPANGLDPAGIREFRDLIRSLGARGKTVFMSSHILAEVEQTCDHVGIVKDGQLVAEGAVAELLRRSEALEIRAGDMAGAERVLSSLPFVERVTAVDGRLVVDAPHRRAAELNRALAEQQIYLSELRPRDASLEEFFLEVTGEARDGG